MSGQITGLVTDMSAVKSDVEFLREEIPKIQKQITDLENLMTSRFDEVKELLLTPHGQRGTLFSEKADKKE